MSEYQFPQSAVIIHNGSDETIERQATKLEKKIEAQIKNNQLSFWDMDNNQLIGSDLNNMFWVAGLGNKKIIYDSTVSYLAFGDNTKDNAADKPIETYRSRPTPKQKITLLAGRKAGINYTSNGESGTIINTTGKLIFHADKPTFIEVNENRKYLGKQDSYGHYIDVQKGSWTITSGDANNEIYLGIGNHTITVGNGDNVITGYQTNADTDITLLHHHITLGNGNNFVALVGNTTMKAGKGNDTLYASYYNETIDYTQLTQYIDAGDGDNSIDGAGNATIISGSGDDHIHTSYYNDHTDLTHITQHINAGDGDNSIDGAGNVTITAGNGNNDINTLQNEGHDDPTDVAKLTQEITVGNGNNYITAEGNVILKAGNGRNNIYAGYYSFSTDITKINQQITVGNGNNTIKTTGNVTVMAGNGNNDIDTYNVFDTLQNIYTGDGDNSISAAGSVTVIAGHGNDTIDTNYYTNSSDLNEYIDAGEGNNSINAIGNLMIISGKGTDSFEVNTETTYGADLPKFLGQVNTKDGDKYLWFGGNLNYTAGDGKHYINQSYGNPNKPAYNQVKNRIHLGNGKIKVELSDGATTITAGNGGGTIHTYYGYMDLTLGDGNYKIEAKDDNRTVGHNIVRTGNGDNIINFDEMNRNQEANNITTGNGNDAITITGNQNTIHAGLGHNIIHIDSAFLNSIGENYIYTDLGSFNTINISGNDNHIYSLGQDTIRSNDYQTNVTLLGGNSEVHVNNAVINDLSHNNTITANLSSTIIGSTDSTIQFTNQNGNYLPIPDPGHDNLLIGGNNDTISATEGSNLNATRGSNNHYVIDGNFTFVDGINNNTAVVNGNASIQGSDSLNLTLNVKGTGNNIFEAGNGNETLNGIQSQGALRVYANHNRYNFNPTNLVATTGSGDDVLYAGKGSSTFTGGLGNNTFVFDQKNDIGGGKTIITDFSISQGNKIGLFNYGLDQDGLKIILQNAKNDNQGDSVLNLNNHIIIIQGINSSDLHTDQFLLAPTDAVSKPT